MELVVVDGTASVGGSDSAIFVVAVVGVSGSKTLANFFPIHGPRLDSAAATPSAYLFLLFANPDLLSLAPSSHPLDTLVLCDRRVANAG